MIHIFIHVIILTLSKVMKMDTVHSHTVYSHTASHIENHKPAEV